MPNTEDSEFGMIMAYVGNCADFDSMTYVLCRASASQHGPFSLVLSYEHQHSSEAESVLAENVIYHISEHNFFLLGHVGQTLAPFLC